MSSLVDVPKPTNAGAGQRALANVKLSYVNIRSGPGTQYRDIGDLRDHALVLYYPQTRTDDNWFWIEYRGLSGWVAGSVVTFEPVIGGETGGDTTPYDGKVAVWHWKGEGIAENSIEAFAENLKNRAPNVEQVWVKTSDGSEWMGTYDSSPLAINGVADVDRWVDVLSRYGLEFHAWCIPQGLDPLRETALITAVCQRPGVRSMILDVEPYNGFWQGGQEGIRPYMLQIRVQLGGEFHLGMSVDPRPQHFERIFPFEWYPFVDSVHPQSYWYTFRETPEETLREVYETWGTYGRPVIPVLQGDAPLVDQQAAHALATGRHGAQGLSWWRYGVIAQYNAVNTPVVITDPGAPPIEDGSENFTDEVVITPESAGFRSGTYTGQPEFQSFDGTWGWQVYYKETEPRTSSVWAEWRTELPTSGRYEIATFVPQRHSTSQRARFKVHGIRGTNTEVVIDVNQAANRNRWVPLGIFELEPGQPNAGKVFLNDVTGETGREIAFDAIRFRRIVVVEQPDIPEPPPSGDWIIDGVYIADGFDSPVGTASERAGAQVWPSGWRDATGFGSDTDPNYLQNFGAYHTGVDLNVGSSGNADLGVPVYAPASGVVTYQADLRPWGNVTVIQHDPLKGLDGFVVYTRYGHMQNVRVQVGERVRRGDQIGEIGTGGGRYIAHLHFDVSPTTVLEVRPGDWPGMDLDRLRKNYVDPLLFVRNNRPDPDRR